MTRDCICIPGRVASTSIGRVAEIIPFPTSPSSRERDAEHPSTVKEAIGSVLREERTDQERTLADVAESAAVSLPYLSEIERGQKDVSSELLGAVCGALQIEVADVLARAADVLRLSKRGSGTFLMAA